MAPIASTTPPTDNPLCHAEYFVARLTTFSAEQKPPLAIDHQAILTLLKKELVSLISKLESVETSIELATPDKYLDALEVAQWNADGVTSLLDTIKRTPFYQDLGDEVETLTAFRESLSEYADDFDLALHRLPQDKELTRLMRSM